MDRNTIHNDILMTSTLGDKPTANPPIHMGSDLGRRVNPPISPPPGSPDRPEQKQKHILQGGELRGKLAEYIRLVDELESAMTSLPHVQDGGGSECPFAGELYAKKEELEAKVIDAVKHMHSFMADLNRELQRHKANLARIQSDAERLNLQETQQEYDTAETEQAALCRRMAQDRDAITVALGKAEAVLKVSQQRKHPKGVPAQKGPQLGPGPQLPVSGTPQTHPRGLGKEIKDLFPLGPLGKGPGSK